ncbi:MAG: hypothetical protein GQ531_10410 [Sulfurovum sp.]|nr:hypothetical protein [Sulfurovum sp.]
MFKDIAINVENNSVIQSFIKDCKLDIDAYIKLEEKDINAIVNTKGKISTIAGEGKGKDAVNESMQSLINNFADYQDIKTILIRFYTHETFPAMEFQAPLNDLYQVFGREEEIIISILIDNTLSEDCVSAASIIKQHVVV